MQRNLDTPFGRSRLLSWITLTLAAMAMTACGPLGDDESDPEGAPESIAQPTSASVDTVAASPDRDEASLGPALATPATSLSTPIATDPNGTPDQPFTVIVGTPTAPEPAGIQGATPVDTAINPGAAGSDGTSGATPDPVNDGTADVEPDNGVVRDSTPTEDPAGAAVVATPGAGTSPESDELANLDPVPVSGCDPETIPPFNGSQTEFLTNSDVNFRTGPGTDCDTIGDGPIGTNFPVTVLSEPVVRTDDGEMTWVQVQIAGETGWIILEVLEPAS